MPQCRSCGAQIDWVVTKAGKNMPVDPEYVDWNDAEDRMVLVTDQGNVYTVDHNKNYSSVRGRISHFASCPNADKHRKGK